MDCKIDINGYEVQVIDGAYVKNGQVTDEGKAFAKSLVANLQDYKVRAAANLLSLYNETWKDDEIGELTESQFAELLVAPEIVLYDEIGAAIIYFNDSDMFAGHSVEVSIDEFEVDDIGLVG